MPAKNFGRNVVLAITSAAALTLGVTASANAAGFTAEQAAAGETAYQSNCSQCHGVKLEGPEAPGLFGQDVMGNWDTAGGLFDFISVAMPPAAPGQLGDETYLNIVAYVMTQNGAKAGTEALTKDTMAAVSLVAETKEGAAALEAATAAEAGADAEVKIEVPQAYTWGKELPQAK